MKTRLLKILDFFRLIDEHGTLSLTNISVMVVLVKLTLEPTLNYAAVGTLLGVIGAYSFKRYVQRSKPSTLTTVGSPLEDDIKKLQDKVLRLELAGAYVSDD